MCIKFDKCLWILGILTSNNQNLLKFFNNFPFKRLKPKCKGCDTYKEGKVRIFILWITSLYDLIAAVQISSDNPHLTPYKMCGKLRSLQFLKTRQNERNIHDKPSWKPSHPTQNIGVGVQTTFYLLNSLITRLVYSLLVQTPNNNHR